MPSHRLLLRAGYVRQLGSGIYSLLPLGHRVAQRITQIIREEMDAIGCQELLMPVVHPADIWRESGRYDAVGPEMARLPCNSAQMATALKRGPGDMGGYPAATEGFPSNMQPALAYAAGAGGEAGRKAWAQFMKRSVKPDYGASPQFAIVPR